MSSDQTPPQTMALTPRQEHLLAIRDNMTNAQPHAIVPSTFAEAQAFAQAIADSNLIPDGLKKRAPDVLMIVLAGAEFGFAPVRSISLFHVIEGVPKPSSDALAALVLASPLCEHLEPIEMSAEKVVWEGKRVGRPAMRLAWTKEDAIRQGVWGKKNYITSPMDMLNSRCKAKVAKILWPDVCAGLTTAEEWHDEQIMRDANPAPASFGAPPTPAAAASSATSPVGTKSNPIQGTTPANTGNKSKGAAATKPPIDAASAPVGSSPPSTATTTTTTPAAAASPAADPTPRSSEPPPRSEPQPDSAPAATPSGSTMGASSSPAAEPAASAAAGADDFGDERPDADAMTFANFVRDIQAVKPGPGAEVELAAVKTKWLPWSKQGQPGFEHAENMRTAFAKAKADIVGSA